MQCVSSNGQFVFFLQGFSRNTHFKQMLLTFICNKLVKCVRNKISMSNLFSCNASLHYLSKELKGHGHLQKVLSTFDCAIMMFLQKRLVIILSSWHTLKSRFKARVARLRARLAILKRNTLHERIDKILPAIVGYICSDQAATERGRFDELVPGTFLIFIGNRSSDKYRGMGTQKETYYSISRCIFSSQN